MLWTLIRSASLLISQENICCGYSLEAPRWGASNQHYENTPIQIYRTFNLQKNENFKINNSDIFIRRGSSNEYPRSMFWAGSLALPRMPGKDSDQTSRFITKTRLFKYTENLTTKKWKFSDKKFWYFSYFCSKHRLSVLVRTASARRF